MNVVRSENQIDVRVFFQNAPDDRLFLRHAAADAEHERRLFPLQRLQMAEFTEHLVLGVFANSARVEQDDVGIAAFFGPDEPPFVRASLSSPSVSCSFI